MQSQESKVVWGKTDSSKEPAQTQPPSASSTSGPWIEDGWVCLSSHNLWEQGHASPKFCCKPHAGLFQKSTLNSEFSKSPSTCVQQLWNPPSTISSAAWKGNYRFGFICKTNWLFRNSAFGTTAIPEIRSWRKDLPNKNTTCCLKVNFLVFKALLCFRSFSFFTNNFHPLVVPVPTQHSLWLCSTSWVQQDSKKRHLWFFLKTRTSKASAHSKQPAMQSLRSCSH